MLISARAGWLGVVAALGLFTVAVFARSRIQQSALESAGYLPTRDGSLDAFFRARATARRMPLASRMEWYVAFDAGGDSTLLELFWYGPAGARWPVHVYRYRGGGIADVYAQDEWPGLSDARRISAADAADWLLPLTPSRGGERDPRRAP